MQKLKQTLLPFYYYSSVVQDEDFSRPLIFSDAGDDVPRTSRRRRGGDVQSDGAGAVLTGDHFKSKTVGSMLPEAEGTEALLVWVSQGPKSPAIRQLP